MIWAKEETLPREEIEKIQLDKLKTTVSYIYDRVKPYRDKMDAAGVKPEDIQTLEGFCQFASSGFFFCCSGDCCI